MMFNHQFHSLSLFDLCFLAVLHYYNILEIGSVLVPWYIWKNRKPAVASLKLITLCSKRTIIILQLHIYSLWMAC